MSSGVGVVLAVALAAAAAAAPPPLVGVAPLMGTPLMEELPAAEAVADAAAVAVAVAGCAPSRRKRLVTQAQCPSNIALMFRCRRRPLPWFRCGEPALTLLNLTWQNAVAKTWTSCMLPRRA